MMDEQRAKLIELITEYHEAWKHGEGDWKRGLADSIIADGWIRPPCKVGTPLCFLNTDIIYGDCVIETTEWLFVYDADGLTIETENACFNHCYDYVFGKTVFLSREDAEKSLEERKEK